MKKLGIICDVDLICYVSEGYFFEELGGID